MENGEGLSSPQPRESRRIDVSSPAGSGAVERRPNKILLPSKCDRMALQDREPDRVGCHKVYAAPNFRSELENAAGSKCDTNPSVP